MIHMISPEEERACYEADDTIKILRNILKTGKKDLLQCVKDICNKNEELKEEFYRYNDKLDRK